MVITFYDANLNQQSKYAKEVAKFLNFQYVEFNIFFLCLAVYIANRKLEIAEICSNPNKLNAFNFDIVKDREEAKILVNGIDETNLLQKKEIVELANELYNYELFKEFINSKIMEFSLSRDLVINNSHLSLKNLPFADIRFIIMNSKEIYEILNNKNSNLNAIEKQNTIAKIKELSQTSNELNKTYIINKIDETNEEIINECLKKIKEHIKLHKNRGLRLLLTSECNYNCTFCHKEGLEEKKKELLTAEDYKYLCEILKQEFGVYKVGISGGEPLLREDICEIVKGIKNVGLNVGLTTNGYYLDVKKEVCKSLMGLNISLHANDELLYETITNSKDSFKRVKSNIKEIRKKFPKLKIAINVVYSKEVFEDYNNIISMINLAIETNCILKFIEVYPKTSSSYLNIDLLKNLFVNLGYYLCDESFRKSRYVKGSCSIVLEKCFCSAVEKEKDPELYCKENNDIFLTSEGAVRFCRNSCREVSLLKYIKNRDKEQLVLVLKQVLEKAASDCCFKKVSKRRS